MAIAGSLSSKSCFSIVIFPGQLSQFACSTVSTQVNDSRALLSESKSPPCKLNPTDFSGMLETDLQLQQQIWNKKYFQNQKIEPIPMIAHMYASSYLTNKTTMKDTVNNVDTFCTTSLQLIQKLVKKLMNIFLSVFLEARWKVWGRLKINQFQTKVREVKAIYSEDKLYHKKDTTDIINKSFGRYWISWIL